MGWGLGFFSLLIRISFRTQVYKYILAMFNLLCVFETGRIIRLTNKLHALDLRYWHKHGFEFV